MRQMENSSTRDPFFLRELSRLGPHDSAVPPARTPPVPAGDPTEPSAALDATSGSPTHGSQWTLTRAQAYTRMWARHQYENFTVVSFLIPRRIRQDFYNVYSFCRWSDNLADEVEDRQASQRLMDQWHAQLELCAGGQPTHPVMVALQDTITSHQLALQPFFDLLTAFRQDQRVQRYATDESLLEYCRYSANPVGRILLSLACSDSPHHGDKITEEMGWLSNQICTGLQLTNFCQDMARDAHIGRIYAPQSLWERHGVLEEQILQARATPQLRALLAEWVATSRGYLERGLPLVELVPSWLATDVELFARGGLAVLKRIESQQYDVWRQRPTLSKTGKLKLLVQALWHRRGAAAHRLDEVRS